MPIDLLTFENEFNQLKRLVEDLAIAQIAVTDENQVVVRGAHGRVVYMGDKIACERIALNRARELNDELRTLKEDYPAVGKMLEEEK